MTADSPLSSICVILNSLVGVLAAAVCFFAAELPAAKPANYLSKSVTEGGDLNAPTWVVDPALPGKNMPPIGRSLFDFLVIRQQDGRPVVDVPFPLTALLDRVAEGLRRDSATTDTGLKKVLIPLGRSLQRSAAAPDFFAFPRVVAAVDGEAKTGNAMLRDRLYLGYQEKARQIEVISYNEAAARFEFQIVKDYQPGGRAKVFYANRAMCMACHQNGGPIFSRQVWNETNANPKIAALLNQQKRDFYGIPVDRGVDVPNAIDEATGRANLFAVYQLLWREGCGANDAAARRCRARLFVAALQYRLTGGQFEHGAAYRDAAEARIVANSSRHWPRGLAIGNPGIPNRDPLADMSFTGGPAQHKLAAVADIAAPFDPLQAREPSQIWRMQGGAEAEVDRLVRGLGEFLADADIVRLDRRLRNLASGSPRQSFSANCRVTGKPLAGIRTRVEFRCLPNAEKSGLSLDGELELTGRRVTGGLLHHIAFGSQPSLIDVGFKVASATQQGRQWRVAMLPLREGRTLRGADGNAIARIDFTWQPGNDGDLPGEASAIVVKDFVVVEQAIAAMLGNARESTNIPETSNAQESPGDAFDAQAFRRASLMPGLFERLGEKPGDWCCLDATGMPPAEPPEKPAASFAGIDQANPKFAALRPFYQYCSTCHQSAERFPPNFLAGTAEQVSANLAHCAERLYVRLSMWRLPEEQRPKTPMPPSLALRARNTDAQQWAASSQLAAIGDYVGKTLGNAAGGTARLDKLPAGGYEKLRECLPPG